MVKNSKKNKTKKRNNKNKKKKVLKKSKKGDAVKVNWLLALIMSILFGMLGVDRFMMNKVGTGIAKLLITVFTLGLLGWIWWIIDIILIASRYNFKDVVWVE